MTRSQLLRGLSNIGSTIAARLDAVGIRTIADLQRAGGPAAAYCLIKDNNPDKTLPVCYYLYSLQGALDDVHWDALPKTKKEELLRQVEAIEAASNKPLQPIARRRAPAERRRYAIRDKSIS